MLIIKRYTNRKLYDTHAKRYVTLDDIAAMIRRGEKVRVIDHATGSVITSQIQAQILLEQQRQTRRGLPNTVMTGLIQASSGTLNQLRRTLLPLDWEARVDSEIEQRVQTLIDRGALTRRQGNKLLEQLLSVGSPDSAERRAKGHRRRISAAAQAALAHALAAHGAPTRKELKELTAQVEALANELEKLRSAAKPGPARRTANRD